RDSNPRDAYHVCSLSKRVPSTARPPLPAARTMLRCGALRGPLVRKKLLEFIAGKSAAEKVSLRVLASAVAEELHLRFRLDAFGLNFETQRVGHGNDCGNDRKIVGVVGNIAHEGAVDLELVDRKTLEIRQRRVAGAEIVEGERDSDALELTHDADRILGVVHGHALGDFELQRFRM